MVLNYIWIFFFLSAFYIAALKVLITGDATVLNEVVKATFDSSKTAFEISIGITGVLTLWLGLMSIGEKGGAVGLMSKAVGPFFRRLFPQVPQDHPAMGSMMMNFAANILGLDNAATPMGLKAMNQLQELNTDKDTATNAQIMFLVLNASGLTIIPISIMAYRAQASAANPADIFLPILFATTCSTLAGFIICAVLQKVKLSDPVILAYIGGLLALIGGLGWNFHHMDQEAISQLSSLISNSVLIGIITLFLLMAWHRKVNVYEAFIEGAKEGFGVAIKIIPYLVAMLVAIAVFRVSGTLDILIQPVVYLCDIMGWDKRFIDALPTALMKPLSGSGARGMMVDTMTQFGADSFAGRLSCIFQGAADTTFYIAALYYGSVGIRKIRYTIGAALIADAAGVAGGIFIGYYFFG